MSDVKYEMVACIVNAGFADEVMTAAKKAGAMGGTIIHARGTANKEAEAMFNITIQPDKELVLILVPSSIADDVMRAVYNDVGLNSPGQGIAFCLPVTRAIGLVK